MENFLGLLRIRVIRGVNLAGRDLGGSDPYVVVTSGDQVSFYLLSFSFPFFFIFSFPGSFDFLIYALSIYIYLFLPVF